MKLIQTDKGWQYDQGGMSIVLVSRDDERAVAMLSQHVADGQIAPIAHVVPEAVSMRQARLALLGAGKLKTINNAIAGLPGVQGEAARVEWEFASEVRRDSPLISQMAQALGLSNEQIDSLFVSAADL